MFNCVCLPNLYCTRHNIQSSYSRLWPCKTTLSRISQLFTMYSLYSVNKNLTGVIIKIETVHLFLFPYSVKDIFGFNYSSNFTRVIFMGVLVVNEKPHVEACRRSQHQRDVNGIEKKRLFLLTVSLFKPRKDSIKTNTLCNRAQKSTCENPSRKIFQHYKNNK